ncbi:MAG: tetratricopeptide repeat protein [Planctomycetia bacterium]|nr:tetratricopeptide repeat protein [Planctomycetia bacterium]
MASIAELLQAGLNFHASGNLQQAEQSYRQVLEADSRNADAMHLLGLIALQVENHPMAIEYLTAAIRVDGGQAVFHAHLGEAYRKLGQLDQAIACYRQALRIKPDDPQSYNNLGTLLHAQAKQAEAQASHAGASAVAGQSAAQQQYSDAAAAYREALRLNPDYAEALINHGLLIQAQGQLDEALACFERAAQLKPNLAIAHTSRANVYRAKRMPREAIASYQAALGLKPNYPDAYNNLASLFNEIDQPDLAVAHCQKGLELDPNSASLHGNLAIALQAQGRSDEAIVSYRKSVELQPDDAKGHSHLIYNLNFQPAYDAPSLFAEHLAWAKRHAEPLTALAPPHANERAPDRRLRVGYVSAHFRRHAVHFFTEPILAAHDHEQFEIFCYSAVLASDEVTARFKAVADHWRDVGYDTDEQIAQRVREDRIDILVDLAGHIGQNRLLVFARKPAPIQVTYLGYQNTTGMTAMDYRITDERADPPGLTEAFYTEQLVRLPRSFFCYQPPGDAPPVTPLPAREAGYVTFGSFNAFAKISPRVIAAWWQILARVPRSRLLVLAYRGGYLERHLHESAEQRGIDPKRVELCNRVPTAEYLRLVSQADIALDSFPFNGHTTTCDSIWMGVPVVVLEGNTYASRFGGSVLANVGLGHLITRTVEQYVDAAAELAANIDRLADLRRELRPSMADSALLDSWGFTRHLERVYRQMWLKWCGSSTKKNG